MVTIWYLSLLLAWQIIKYVCRIKFVALCNCGSVSFTGYFFFYLFIFSEFAEWHNRADHSLPLSNDISFPVDILKAINV
jgi:hypothetical protein